MITPEEKREIRQLWFVAKHYLRLSARIQRKLPKNVLSFSIGTASVNASEGALDPNQKRMILLTAHLGSCAVRLNTIEDILGIDVSKRLQKYKSLEGSKTIVSGDLKKALPEIIHFLLRNNIGHREPGGTDNKPSHNIMEEFLGKLTIEEVYENMQSVVQKIEKDLLIIA